MSTKKSYIRKQTFDEDVVDDDDNGFFFRYG